MSRFKHLKLSVAAVTLAAVGLTGCGTADPSGAPSGGGSKSGSDGDQGGSMITKTWDLEPVDSVSSLVPAEFKDKPITNAIYNNFPPQEFLEDKTLVGIQPDIALALSEVMGVKMNNASIASFDSLIPGVNSGRYDMSSADFGVTEDRLKEVDFVTQFQIGTAFAVKKGSDVKIGSNTDLCGLSVGVQAGSYFIDQIEAADKDCKAAGKEAIDLKAFPDDAARTSAVVNGRIQATATTQDAMGYAVDQQGVALEIQDFVYEPLEQAIVIPNDSKLGPAVEAAMKEIVENGTYAKILEKWGVTDIAYDSPDQVLYLTDPSQNPSS